MNGDSDAGFVAAVAAAQQADVAVLALGESGLKPFISSIGLFNTKAANVIALCRRLIEEYGGKVPRTREALIRLGMKP